MHAGEGGDVFFFLLFFFILKVRGDVLGGNSEREDKGVSVRGKDEGEG